jgi:predicted Na+-dependent transporter
VKILRTIIWIPIAAYLALIVGINWGEPQRVRIWMTSSDAIGADWPVGFIVIAFLMIGAVPTYLYHRSVRWTLERRIRALENSLKNMALARQAETAVPNAAPIVDSPVDKAGAKAGEPADPFNPSNPGSAGDGK